MAKEISTVHKACREVWRKALKKPVHITFETTKEAARAKFVLYDSVRKEKRTGEGDPEILKASANVELALSDDKKTIIARLKTTNPFYGDLCGRLQEVLGQVPPEKDAVTESMEKLEKALKTGGKKEEKAEPGPVNPYYNREEL